MEDTSTYDSSVYDSSLYESSSSMGSTGDAAAVGAVFLVIGIIALIAYVISAIFMGMIFKKAGIPAWKAWVPVYNTWTFLEMGGQKGWISLLLLTTWIPFVGFVTAIVATVYMCIAAYRIGLNFGKEAWFVVLYIFLGLVWLIWLAVDKNAVWKPAAADAAPLGAASVQPTQSQQVAPTRDDSTPPTTPTPPSTM